MPDTSNLPRNIPALEYQGDVEFVEKVPCANLSTVSLSLFAIIRDCAPRVQEWLAFYHLMGVERFFIALHECSDDTEAQIRKLPFTDDIVLYHVAPEQRLPQFGTYKHLLEWHKDSTEWAIFVDDDEFIWSKESSTLLPILNRYRSYGGVVVHWKWFGSNDHVLRPAGLVIENYTRRASDEETKRAVSCIRGVKTILHTPAYKGVRSSHLFYTDPICCNTQYRAVNPCNHWQSGYIPQWDALQCNHYKVRSMEDWIVRYRRGDCMLEHNSFGVNRFKADDINTVKDTDICCFASKIKEILQ